MNELDLLWGRSQVMSDLLANVRRFIQRVGAGAQLPSLLILGETGTGKTRLAEALHRISPRKGGPYVDCRLENMPESLIESELFGHEKGAFTGATGSRHGLFQAANGGTLLLDEIGVASPALQVKLLKAVEERVVRRVGSTRSESFDAWIISATNEDLGVAIRERRFREDLYHRLAILTLRLPPLRERGPDTLHLARYFLNRTATDYRLGQLAFTRAAETRILEHSWPGNVRELANTVERAALLTESKAIDAEALDLRPGWADGALARPSTASVPENDPHGPGPSAKPGGLPSPSTLRDAMRGRVEHALERHGGNISRAARELGVARNTLRAHMRRLNLGTAPPGTAPRPRQPLGWAADASSPTSGDDADGRSPATAAGVAPLDPAPAVESREPRPAPIDVEAGSVPPPLIPDPAGLSDAGVSRMTAVEQIRPRVFAWERQLVAFVTIALDPPADVIAAQLAPTLEEIIDKVEPFGGRIRDVRPHGLTAVFGVEPLDDFSRRAANAAIAALKAVERAAVGPLAEVVGRVALHVEECLVAYARGAVGMEPEHENGAQTVLDKILALAPPGAAVVSRAAARLLERRFELAAMDADGHAFRLTRQERSGLEVSGRHLSRFVGRAREIAALEALLQEAEGGRGQIAGVVGAPGLGKTRLIRELLQGLMPERATAWEGRCISYASASPYHPLIEILRQSLDLQDGDGAGAIADKIRSEVTALDLEADELTPFFLHLLGAADSSSMARWSPEAIRQRTMDAIRRLALAGSGRRPLVIVVEDLQWVDQTSEDTLASLAESIAGAPIVLLTSYRPGYRPPWSGRSNFTQLALAPLSGEDSLALVRSLATEDDLAVRLSDRILSRAGGVPLFLEELTRALTDDPKLAGDTIPDTIQATLAARLGRLSVADRALLQTASVIGRDVSGAVLAAVTGVIDAPLRESLGRLEQAEFLFDSRGGSSAAYAFKHVLTQEVAYRSLPEEQRRVLHGRVAEAIMRVTPDAAEQRPEILASHCALGGLTAKAIAEWHRAGQRAMQRSANVEAITHLTTGLGLLERFPAGPERYRRELGLQLSLNTALVAHRGFGAEEVERTVTRVRALMEELGDSVELVPVRFGLARFYLARAEFGPAEEFGRQVLAAGERYQDPQILVAGHSNLGVTAFYRGQLTTARQHLLEVQRLYDPASGPAQAALYGQDLGPITLGFLGWTQVLLGEVDRGAIAAELALERARAGGHPFTLAFALMTAGLVGSERREAAVTQRHGDELLALSEQQSFRFFSVFGCNLAGYGRMLAGDQVRGLALMREGFDRYHATQQRIGMRFRALLAEVLVETDHVEEALARAEALLAHAAETGEGGSLSEVYRVKAHALWRRGAADADVEALLSQALDIALGQKADLFALRAASSLVRFHRERTIVSSAITRLDEIYTRFGEGLDVADLVAARTLIRGAPA